MVFLGTNVTFSCGKGGTITTVGSTTDLATFGVSDDGWAYFDDLQFNTAVDMSLNLSGVKTKATINHLPGDGVFAFDLTSGVLDGRCDVKAVGLPAGEWYRLQFDGVLARTVSGYAHGTTGEGNAIQFNGVHVPE